VNRDHERDRTMIARVSPDRLPVERFDLNAGAWERMDAPRVGEDALLRLRLRPGDGALLRFQ
jgi:hypothetical protein